MLPIEIQLQIWTYAASPKGGLQLTDRLLLDKEIYTQMMCDPGGIGCYLRVLAVDYMSYYMSLEAEVLGRATIQARSQLSLVCQFARVIVLEVYKRELEQMTYGGFHPSDMIHWGSDCRGEIQDAIAKRFQDRIE